MAELHNSWAFAFGILGNVISFMVYLAPVPTFYRICKKRSTEGFQAVPYVIALFSAMLMIYYALVKTHSTLLLTINGIGCFIETLYIVLFLLFAPKKARISTLMLLLVLNVVAYSAIVSSTFFLLKGANRVRVIGWINVGFSISVFVAPLSIVRLVIRTKSVEFMPFGLSFFLTVSAVVWFTYGFLIRDLFVAAPNILCFLFGVVQMVLYVIYRQPGKAGEAPDGRHPDTLVAIRIMNPTSAAEVHPIESAEDDDDVEAGRPAAVLGGAVPVVLGVEKDAAVVEVELGLPRA